VEEAVAVVEGGGEGEGEGEGENEDEDEGDEFEDEDELDDLDDDELDDDDLDDEEDDDFEDDDDGAEAEEEPHPVPHEADAEVVAPAVEAETRAYDADRVPDEDEIPLEGSENVDVGPPQEVDPRLENVLAPQPRGFRAPTAPSEPGDEQAMVLYSEEVEEEAGLATTEYEDDLTADEDRPMMPEISAGRRRERGRDRDRRSRRDERRAEREARKRDRAARRGGGGGGEVAAAAPVALALPSGPPAPDDLAAGAAFTLGELKDGQPVQVRQLAQMMRKRRLFNGEPDKMWPHLRAALIHDERAHRSRGLRPRVVARGRDLFALPGGKIDPQLAAAETALAQATLQLEQHTRRALGDKLGQVALPVLEQVAHVWLIHAGYKEVEWVKRVDRSAYATAQSPDIGPVLIGVRSGDQPVDRRGVGELRAGVAAKGMAAGVLLSARPLSGEALAELEKAGKPVVAICGDVLTSALIGARIGVQTAAVPVVYLDADYFEELARG
jgi:hypothetical protein